MGGGFDGGVHDIEPDLVIGNVPQLNAREQRGAGRERARGELGVQHQVLGGRSIDGRNHGLLGTRRSGGEHHENEQ